ncbi:MAG: hypothetical protein H7Z71_08550 [Moraxellaceae bacterium]|nr:hypothetical protein [Pseudobdellovibrionaceae bacterium]
MLSPIERKQNATKVLKVSWITIFTVIIAIVVYSIFKTDFSYFSMLDFDHNSKEVVFVFVGGLSLILGLVWPLINKKIMSGRSGIDIAFVGNIMQSGFFLTAPLCGLIVGHISDKYNTAFILYAAAIACMLKIFPTEKLFTNIPDSEFEFSKKPVGKSNRYRIILSLVTIVYTIWYMKKYFLS